MPARASSSAMTAPASSTACRLCTMLYFSTASLTARATANPGRVDQHDRLSPRSHLHEHAVARGARLGRGDQAVAADEPIDQRRLADVRAADDGDLGSLEPRGAFVLGREERPDDRLDELVDALAVQRGDADRAAEAERVELASAISPPRPRPC